MKTLTVQLRNTNMKLESSSITSTKDRPRNNCRLPDVEHVSNVLGTMESCPTYFCLNPNPTHVAAPRRGAASIVAIAVLVILSGIMAQQVRRVVMERRQMRNEVAFLQAEKLADAGLLLAQKSRSKDPAWMGLTWNLPAGAIHQTNSAEVVITVKVDSCTVVARYPANAEIPFQVTRTRKLAL